MHSVEIHLKVGQTALFNYKNEKGAENVIDF